MRKGWEKELFENPSLGRPKQLVGMLLYLVYSDARPVEVKLNQLNGKVL